MHSGRHLENLNPPQLEAVQHFEGPILVLAGAGTGKTRILTRRISHLILEHRVRASSILAVTFTNKACGEMRERLQLLLGDVPNSIWISTFHSMGLRILRRHADLLGYGRDFNVYDAADSKDVVKRILKDRNIDEKKFPINGFTSFIDKQKNIPLFPEDLTQESKKIGDSMHIEVYDLYQRALRAANAFDFGDLLSQTYKLFKEHPSILKIYQENLNFILVDEFQDTNVVQYDIIRMLTGQKRNLLVVGDDDQSIYAFRGATIQNILDFEKDFPETKTVKLEQNYRSTSAILESAHAVIVKNTARKDKKLWTSSATGDPVKLYCGFDETDEARYIAQEIRSRVDGGLTYGDIAVFYRTNAQSRAIEEAFLNFRIPYKVYGGLKFYDRKEIKDIIAYLRLIANKADNQAFLRVINNPTRGIGAQAVQQIVDLARSDSLCYFDAAKNVESKSIQKFVRLIEKLKESYRGKSLSDLIHDIIEDSEYGPRLRKMSDDPQAQSRIENLQELRAVAMTIDISAEEDPLQQFLDRIALTASSDDTAAEGSASPKEAVSLMTLHLAKGLEFDIVYFTGFEEGLVPHYKCMYNPEEVYEERRLCYVGMTRARHALFLTRVRKRGMFSTGGDTSRFREPSRFAFDLPKTMLLDVNEDFFVSGDAYVEPQSSYAYDEEDDLSSGWNSSRKTKALPSYNQKGSKGGAGKALWGLVKTADDLSPAYKVEHLPMLSVEQVQSGCSVMHSSFGKGTIQGSEGDPSNETGSFKVLVKFDDFKEVKKLVYRFAGLRVG